MRLYRSPEQITQLHGRPVVRYTWHHLAARRSFQDSASLCFTAKTHKNRRNRLRHTRFFWMRRHARVVVLSIVTFNYWFLERESYRSHKNTRIHKFLVFKSMFAITVPQFVKQPDLFKSMFTFGLCLDLEWISEYVWRLREGVMGFHNDWTKSSNRLERHLKIS